MVQSKKKGFLDKFLDVIEKGGNKLPHPVTLFVILSAAIVLISAICSAFGVTVTYEVFDKEANLYRETSLAVQNLLNGDGIRHMVSSAVRNFVNFAPLGTVLVGMLGVSVAEHSGFIQAAMRKLVLATPRWLITGVIVFAGIMSNIASDVGYIVLIPLGAIVFKSFNRHPLAGLAAAFAGVSGGFSANLLIGTLDPMLGGLSTEAAHILAPDYIVQPTANWYFMMASTFLITGLGWFVTEKIVEPRLGEYKGTGTDELAALTDSEKKGLRASLIATIIFVAVIVLMCLPNPDNKYFYLIGLLRNPANGSLLDVGSAFMGGIVFLIALFFFVIGLSYGLGASTIKKDGDVVGFMSKGMAEMSTYLVLVFVSAQFTNYFSYSNLGTVIAVNGADFLEAIKFTGVPLFVVFILIVAFINLFIGSASAKWAILAPVFVPMFMTLGYSPEITQLAYRIGDSTTNIISPLMSYFAFVIAYSQKHDENAGIGTIVSMMIPYSIVFLIGWTALMVIWFVLGLPIGPGAPIFFSH